MLAREPDVSGDGQVNTSAVERNKEFPGACCELGVGCEVRREGNQIRPSGLSSKDRRW